MLDEDWNGMARPITFDPEEALEQALEVFWTRGYHDTSVEDIVQASGLNRHSLYGRFGSKLGLLRAVTESYRERAGRRIDEVLDGALPARDKVAALLALREGGSEDPIFGPTTVRGCFLERIGKELRHTHPEFHEGFRAFAAQVEQRLAQVIARGQADGQIRAEQPPGELASVMLAGFLLPLVYQPDEPATRAFVSLLG